MRPAKQVICWPAIFGTGQSNLKKTYCIWPCSGNPQSCTAWCSLVEGPELNPGGTKRLRFWRFWLWQVVRQSGEAVFPPPQGISSEERDKMPETAAAIPLTFDIERKGNTAIVRCHGKLLAGVSDRLYACVSQLVPDCQRIVLDLTDLSHMDSMGLGTLVRLYVHAKSGGSRLELINLGARIRQLLGMTNLLSVFSDMGEKGITIGF